MRLSKKKICFVSPKAYFVFNPTFLKASKDSSKSLFGGAELQMYLLSKEFAKNKNLDINFMLADYGQKTIENFSGVKLWSSINFKDKIFFQIKSFFKIFNKIDANIYIIRTLTKFSGLIALYCRFRRKKCVYMVAHDREIDGKHELYKSFVNRVLANMTFKFSHLIIVQNLYQKRKLKDLKSVDSWLLKSSYKISKAKSIKRDYILWVARSVAWKRPESFLVLAKKFPKESFVMICPPSTTEPELSSEVRKKASALKNVKFIEFVPFSEIDEYFSKAKIFVNTSVSEGFPNTFLQAMVAAVPIVSLNVNPNNLLTENACGVFCQNDEKFMEKAMKDLLQDPRKYSSLSKNGRLYVEENHNIEKNAKLLLAKIIT